jgi:nitroreductase/ferredoxin
MTVAIDQETCTRCGICADVCMWSIIAPPEGDTPARIREEKAAFCIACGQCEAFCPSGSVVAGGRAGTEPASPAGAISPEALGSYLKSRRSVRHYRDEPVPREMIEAVLDVARYAPSGGNGQPVEWLVVHDPAAVRTIAGLTIDWMRELAKRDHPMSGYVPGLIAAWERGADVICRGAPHLVIPFVPEASPIAPIDAIIALTHVDIAAPAFDLGTCWAGFVAMACREHAPLREFLALPAGMTPAYAMMLGFPRFRPHQIPDRKPLRATWR